MIVLPHENTFGYLVIASVSTILVGALFYIIYATRNWNGTALQKCDEVQSLTSSTTSDSDGYGGTDDHTGLWSPSSSCSIQLAECKDSFHKEWKCSKDCIPGSSLKSSPTSGGVVVGLPANANFMSICRAVSLPILVPLLCPTKVCLDTSHCQPFLLCCCQLYVNSPMILPQWQN